MFYYFRNNKSIIFSTFTVYVYYVYLQNNGDGALLDAVKN